MNYYLVSDNRYSMIPKRIIESEVLQKIGDNRVYTIRKEPEDKFSYDVLFELADRVSVDAAIDDMLSDYSCKCTYPGSAPVYTLANGDPGYPGDDPEYDLPDKENYIEGYRYSFAKYLLEEIAKSKNVIRHKDDLYSDPYSLEISNKDREMMFEIADEYYEKEYKNYPDDYEIVEKYLIDDTPEPE